MFDLSENPGCDQGYDLCGNECSTNSICTDSINLFPDRNSYKCCRKNCHCVFKAAPVGSDGIVKNTANLGWGYKEVKKELEELTGQRVKVGNDANVAALGEMWLGAGKGQKNMVMVTLGTGVGGGVIINGKPVVGAHGAGGEIGHICVNEKETISCGCGKQGCLEQYASATGIVRLAKERLAKDEAPSLLREGEVSAKAVFDALKEGDVVAEEIVKEFGQYLGPR